MNGMNCLHFAAMFWQQSAHIISELLALGFDPLGSFFFFEVSFSLFSPLPP